MLIKMTFILENGNEAVFYSGLSPNMTHALVEDCRKMTNACDIAKHIREWCKVEVWSETEFRNKKA